MDKNSPPQRFLSHILFFHRQFFDLPLQPIVQVKCVISVIMNVFKQVTLNSIRRWMQIGALYNLFNFVHNKIIQTEIMSH